MKPFGRGLMQSLRARVDEDVRDLIKSNLPLRRERYRWSTRYFRHWITGRSVLGWLANYALCVAVVAGGEWVAHRFCSDWLIPFTEATDTDFVRDAAGFFITAQVGLLAVLTVAVSVVTLLSEKDDGISVNTDVRLYYVESLTSELVTSGIAFLTVVVVQLFWPLQEFMRTVPGFKNLAHFRYVLTAVHAAWLILNFGLFLQFLKVTLDFVVADNRARLRKRYVATEIIPRDVRRRLLAVYYRGIPTFILGQAGLKAGPLVSFGTDIVSSESGSAELTLNFDAPARLTDIWLLPLGIVLKRWHQNSRILQGQPDRRFGDEHWNGQLAAPPDFTIAIDGKLDLIRRAGGTPLLWWELLLIKWSFKFARVDRRELTLPTPADFIEQLISNVMRRIEAGAAGAFDASLREVTDFHSFVLEAQNTRAEDGSTINMGQLSDRWFLLPDQEWIRAYRRAQIAAVDKLTADPYFANGIARVPISLWPRDPTNYPPSSLQTILELGRYLVITFEEWVTKRALIQSGDADSAAILAGSDLRAYEHALISFVAAWETLETIIENSFDLPRALRGGEIPYWQAAKASWPSLQTHLRNAAYFFASAVWNDDRPGSERYRDLVVRWLQPF